MIYRCFFNECLVNIYFKKKDLLDEFQGEKYSFKNRYIFLVITTTYVDLYNLSMNNSYIRLFS